MNEGRKPRAGALVKNQTLPLRIETLGAQGEGIARHEGMAVFVPGALPGERVRAQIVKVQKQYAFARLLAVETPSDEREQPRCPAYPRCGGCVCQHMRYDATLAFKREQVRACLTRIGGLPVEVPPVLGMEEPWRYRNKTLMPVAGDPPQAGFFAPRSHRLVPVRQCAIAMPPSDGVTAAVLDFMRAQGIPAYDEATHTGLVRHVMTRVSRSGEVMAVLAVNGRGLPGERALASALRARVPGLVSVCVSENTARTNVALGPTYRVLYGGERLRDTLCGLTFELSPLSFFQVNPAQTEKLYGTALRFAALTGRETVTDLYCGAGTITLLLARQAARVTGVESVSAAVADARENARRNGVTNADFIAAPAEEALPRLVREGMRPDVIVLDPPRKGVERPVLEAIAAARPRRVVYVSCNVATQARDAGTLAGMGYAATACQSVDMFCWTAGIENVLLMERMEA